MIALIKTTAIVLLSLIAVADFILIILMSSEKRLNESGRAIGMLFFSIHTIIMIAVIAWIVS